MRSQDECSSVMQMKNQTQDLHYNYHRLRIGKDPFYIEPKIDDNTVECDPQIITETQNYSRLEVPQFHNPSINGSSIFENKTHNTIKGQLISQGIKIQETKQTKQSLKLFTLNLIIWLLYFIGSMETLQSQITPFHVIDLIGNGISLFFVIFMIYSKKGLKSVTQILHIWSIILTVTIFLYPKNSSKKLEDYTFIRVMNGLRSLRLLFPLCEGRIFLKTIEKSYSTIIRSKKIILVMILVILIFGLSLYQIFADTLANKCRNQLIPSEDHLKDQFEQRLCGYRTCPSDKICSNPKRLQERIYQRDRFLNRFDSSIQSMISVFQIFTLNTWGHLSQTYFDVYPSFITVPIYIIGFLIFQKIIFGLIVVYLQNHKEKRQKESPLLRHQMNILSANKNPICLQQIKINANQTSKNHDESSRNFLSTNFSNKNKQKLEINKGRDKKKILFYCILILFSVSHYVLASQFGLNPNNFNEDIYNRKIGIFLAILFIIHFVSLNLIKFQFLSQNDEEQQESIFESRDQSKEQDKNQYYQDEIISIILRFEYLICFISLADYILRVVQGKYILEEFSGLTTLVHFLISLRLFYVFLATVDILNLKAIKKHFLVFLRNTISGLKIVLVYVMIACFLGLISFIINQQDYQNQISSVGLIFEANRFFMLLVNHSWKNLYNFPFTQNKEILTKLFLEIAGIFSLILGSVILFCYFISYLINEAFWNQINLSEQDQIENFKKNIKSAGKKEKDHNKISQSQKQQYQKMKILMNQKSFYLFSFDNCLRKSAFEMTKSQIYSEKIRSWFYLGYIGTNIIFFIFSDQNIYAITSVVLQIFVLFDILTTALALRFFGKFSYSSNNFLPILHLIACFFVIAFSLTKFELQHVPFLQIARVLIVLNYFKKFEETFEFIKKVSGKIFLHFLILIPVLLGYCLVQLLLLSAQNQNLTFINKFIESLKLSFVYFSEKGWDLQSMIGKQNLITLFGQLSLSVILITWIVLVNPYFCSLIGIIISTLVKQKNYSEDGIARQVGDSDFLEQSKIREKIKKMKLKFDFKLYGQGFFLQLCQNKLFVILRKICPILCMLCYLTVNVNLSSKERILVSSIQLFIFTLQILMFIIQSYCYKCNQDYFWRDLVLNIIAVPGSYIVFVNPVRYSNQSYELKMILQFFNLMSILRFIKIFTQFQIFRKIYQLFKTKLSRTIHILLLQIFSASSIGCYLYEILQRKQPILQCFNYSFLGILGGDFYSTVQNIVKRNQLSLGYELHLVYFIVHVLRIFFYSLTLSFFIYEVSEIIKQKMPLRNTDFSLYNFNKYFHEEEFLNEWKNLDPFGIGVVNFRNIMFKSHLFIKNFSVSPEIYKKLQNRIQIFKKLKLPIYQLQTIIQNEKISKSEITNQYVITFYDFLFLFSKFIFQQIKSPKLINKGYFFVKNENYVDQPISFFNIASRSHLDYLSKNLSKDKIVQQLDKEWRNQINSIIKEKIKQNIDEHSKLPFFQRNIKSTNLNSEQLYNAYKIRGKFVKFTKKARVTKKFKIFQKNQQKLNENDLKTK